MFDVAVQGIFRRLSACKSTDCSPSAWETRAASYNPRLSSRTPNDVKHCGREYNSSSSLCGLKDFHFGRFAFT